MPVRAAAGRALQTRYLDEAIRLSRHKPASVLLVDRAWSPMDLVAGRDHLWSALREQHLNASVPCEMGGLRTQLHALHQRHHRQAQRRAARHGRLRRGAGRQHETSSMPRPGRPTSPPATSAGWWGKLHHLRAPDRGRDHHHVRGPAHPPRRRCVVEHRREVQGHAHVLGPTAVRVLKKQDASWLQKYDVSTLKALGWRVSRWTSPRRSGSAMRCRCPSSTTTGRPKRAGPSSRWPMAWSSRPRALAVPARRCMAITSS